MAKKETRVQATDVVDVDIEKSATGDDARKESEEKLSGLIKAIFNGEKNDEHYLLLAFSETEGGMFLNGDTRLLAEIIVKIMKSEPILYESLIHAMASQMLKSAIAKMPAADISKLN